MQEGHILTVLQVTPELNAGGVERTTLEIAQAISRAGGLALVASAGGRLEPDLEATGGELVRLAAQSKNPLTILANALRIARIVKKRRVDIVHARSRAPAWSAWMGARLVGASFVTTFHGIYNARSPLKRAYNSIMAKGDVVIANSEFTREHILNHYDVDAGKVIAIPRGADLGVFDPARVTRGEVEAMREQWGVAPDDSRCVVIAPARLTRWKGQLVLIEAAKLIEQRRPGTLKVILAGDAQGRLSYPQEIQAAIRSAGLREVVAVVGHVDTMAVALAASDIAVFPVTEAEAFGRGAVEAQAMGVPVIASNLGGFTETVVEGETGLLVPPGIAIALAAAIERMVDMGEVERREMGARASARARQLYATSTLQSATLAVYRRLLDGAASKASTRGQGEAVL
ncbi:MAG: glycosyltransferase family 4 protein [Proteobacteria bacterium]|nr:glycosyltransferase family 4 protein [Pseudomonadota bacterium]